MTDFNNHRATALFGKVVRPKVLLTLFLGSLGLSSLVPIYYIITRRGRDGAKGWTFHEDRLDPLGPPEPRVKIRPVRGEGVICQICMGKLKHGLPRVGCDCGKVFHITCLKRTGFCPYCQRSLPRIRWRRWPYTPRWRASDARVARGPYTRILGAANAGRSYLTRTGCSIAPCAELR